MLQMEGSVKPPQISEMFQKFALAFKTKTIEFFAEEENEPTEEIDLSLLDSADEIITGQKVVVIKPDSGNITTQSPGKDPNPNPKPDVQTLETLISSLFATTSSFKASYLHLQTAHSPFDADSLQAADRAAVSHLQRLSQIKQSYVEFHKNPNPNPNLDFSPISHLEAQVEENQSLLRSFEMVFNRLQSDIDRKDAEAALLRQRLEMIERSNSRLEKRLHYCDSSSPELLLSVSLFDSVLQDVCRAAHSFTKILIDLMKKAGWDLELAANSVYKDVDYAKRGHNRYAFLSYICLGMFGGFGLENFGLEGDKIGSEVSNLGVKRKKFLMQFIEHGSIDALELLNRSPDCDFARFCEKKYQQLIHPSMESSMFRNLDQNELLGLNCWGSSSTLYESFVNMASSIWMLHKLAFSFDPTVGIFQVETEVDFSVVYMESITRGGILLNSNGGRRPKVGFTVIPGFRVGKTVIQCQVYLTGMKCED
ncbi:DUF641 family protein (DUF641) [Tasmannia lanceolata]|uniref:DUF641 family protein (DUF641) n=1 Tax=Tasmannia lanceolata TaxID=3420 RepID=UPI004062985D